MQEDDIKRVEGQGYAAFNASRRQLENNYQQQSQQIQDAYREQRRKAHRAVATSLVPTRFGIGAQGVDFSNGISAERLTVNLGHRTGAQYALPLMSMALSNASSTASSSASASSRANSSASACSSTGASSNASTDASAGANSGSSADANASANSSSRANNNTASNSANNASINAANNESARRVEARGGEGAAATRSVEPQRSVMTLGDEEIKGRAETHIQNSHGQQRNNRTTVSERARTAVVDLIQRALPTKVDVGTSNSRASIPAGVLPSLAVHSNVVRDVELRNAASAEIKLGAEANLASRLSVFARGASPFFGRIDLASAKSRATELSYAYELWI